MAETVTQTVTIIATQVISGFSLASTLCTGIEATLDWREQGKSVGLVTRQQAILQIPIGVYSLMRMLGPIPAPKDEEIWLAYGNQNTCTAQGVLSLTSALAGVCLDMCLSLSFLLIIQYGWSEEETRGVATYFYAVVVPLCLLVSGFALVFNLFAYNVTFCFVGTPVTCDGHANDDEEMMMNEDCAPTSGSLIFVRLILFAVNMLHLLVSVYVMARIYFVSRNSAEQEAVTNGDRALSKLGHMKGFLYTACVGLFQIPLAVWSILVLSGCTADLTWLEAVSHIVVTFSGFFNMLVFMLGRRQMQSSYGRMFRYLLDKMAAICCCTNCYGLSELRK